MSKYNTEAISASVPVQSISTGRIYWVLPSVAEKRCRSGNFTRVDQDKAEAIRQASVVYSH